MDIRVGTSGWSYKEWKGSFYPADLSSDDMLRYYATRLPTVEINNSFYRIPKEKVLLEWAEQVPAAFRFVLKASRRITHINRLSAADDSLGYFLPHGERPGASGSARRCSSVRRAFARPRAARELSARVPRTWRAALEFRHASWFTTRCTRHSVPTTWPSWPWTKTKARARARPRAHGDVGLPPSPAHRVWGWGAGVVGGADQGSALERGICVLEAR